MKLSTAILASALPSLAFAEMDLSSGDGMPDMPPGGMDMDMADSSNSMNGLSELNVLDMDGIKDYDDKTAFKDFKKVVAQAVATAAKDGTDQTFCHVGMSLKMGGNLQQMIDKEGKTAMKEMNEVIKPVKMPCGSSVDLSPYLVGAVGNMGFDPKDGTDVCEGTDCRCGALQVKTGVAMKFDFDKLLEGEQGAMLKAMNIKNMDDLMKFQEQMSKANPEDSSMTEEEKEQQEMGFKLMKEGITFSSKVDVYACVNKNSPLQENKVYEIESPDLSIGIDELKQAGFTLKAETTAALTVKEAKATAKPEAGTKVLFTKSDGTTVEVTVKKVNEEKTSIGDTEMPAGSTVEIEFGDGEKEVVAYAALSTSAEMTEITAPEAPDNKLADAADGGNNSAGTSSVGILASVGAIFAALTVAR